MSHPSARCAPLPRPIRLVALAAAALLAACSINPQHSPRDKVYDQERFSADAPFSRTVAAGPEAACDAARRALMSQVCAIHLVEPLKLSARKFFMVAHCVLKRDCNWKCRPGHR